MSAIAFYRYITHIEFQFTEEDCLMWITINGFADMYRIAKRSADRKLRRAA